MRLVAHVRVRGPAAVGLQHHQVRQVQGAHATDVREARTRVHQHVVGAVGVFNLGLEVLDELGPRAAVIEFGPIDG
jgi:hypothetical protein